MALIRLCLVFWIFQTQFHEIIGESHEFIRAGDNATLNCEKKSSYPSSPCTVVSWLFSPDRHSSVHRAEKGVIKQNHPDSSRFSMNSDCSLNIHNVSAEDAGLYACVLWDWNDAPSRVNLGVLTVSAVGPGENPNPQTNVTVQCSVSRYEINCNQNRIRWLDPNRTVMSQSTLHSCVSRLTVKKNDERTFTCEHLSADNKVLVSADYSPELTVKDQTTAAAPTGNHEDSVEEPTTAAPTGNHEDSVEEPTTAAPKGNHEDSVEEPTTAAPKGNHEDSVEEPTAAAPTGNHEDSVEEPTTAAPKGNGEECERSGGWSWFLVLKTVGWTGLISAAVIVSVCTRDTGKPRRSSGHFEMVFVADVSPGNTAAAADYENQE